MPGVTNGSTGVLDLYLESTAMDFSQQHEEDHTAQAAGTPAIVKVRLGPSRSHFRLPVGSGKPPGHGGEAFLLYPGVQSLGTGPFLQWFCHVGGEIIFSAALYAWGHTEKQEGLVGKAEV